MAAGVSLCEPREGMCIDPTAPVPCCIESSLNVSTGRDLGLRGQGGGVSLCKKEPHSPHLCSMCTRVHACVHAHTHTHTHGSVSAYLDLGSVVKSSFSRGKI